jgi:hypothetical protein
MASEKRIANHRIGSVRSAAGSNHTDSRPVPLASRTPLSKFGS